MVRAFIAGLLLCFSSAQAKMSYASALQQIPMDDRQLLSDFFKGLLTQGFFAATLFGQKPCMSFDYPARFFPFVHSESFETKYLLESKGWKIWKKYQELFEYKKYLFLYAERDFLSIFFVHVEKMKSVLEEHKEFFQSHFSEKLLNGPLDRFLSEAFAPNFHLHNFHLAQGLLFGYDWNSCIEFQRRNQVFDSLSYFPYDVPKFEMGTTINELLDGYPEDLIKKQLDYENRFFLRQKWPDTNPFFPTFSQGYVAFEIPYDSQMEKMRKKIIKLYNSDQFFEDFLKILTDEEEHP